MNEEQKRIKAIIDEQIQLLKNNPKLKGKTDAQLWGAELRSRAMKAIHANPDYNINHRAVVKKGCQSDENRSKKQASMKVLMADPEVKAKQKVLKQSPDYIAKHQAGIEKRDNNPDYKVKQRIAVQKARENPEYQENNRKAVQKANGKPISCDGVVYPSRTAAALILAPATMLRSDSKGNWLARQMIKYPERYFFVTKSE